MKIEAGMRVKSWSDREGTVLSLVPTRDLFPRAVVLFDGNDVAELARLDELTVVLKEPSDG